MVGFIVVYEVVLWSYYYYLLLAGLHKAQPCQYCFSSVVQNWVFRPAGATW